jgi:hypothetical protein
MSENLHELAEALFTRYIFVGPTEKGNKYGWEVSDAAEQYDLGYVPAAGYAYMGIHKTQKEATDAAIKYIYKCRRDIVKICTNEAKEGIRYRAARRNSDVNK